MDLLTAYGLLSVSLMLAFYGLEYRSPTYVFLFALSCMMAAAYGFLQGAWPFGAVELVWSLVALRRWWIRRLTEQAQDSALRRFVSAARTAQRAG